MARFDRCSICDYTDTDGSSIMGVSPGKNGKVRFHPRLDDLLCSACYSSIINSSGAQEEDFENDFTK